MNTVTRLSHSYFKWQANKRLARMSTNKWNWKKYVHIIFRALSMPINAHTHAHTLSFLDGIHCPMLWHVCNSKDIWPSSIGLLSSYYYYVINFFLLLFSSLSLQIFTKTLSFHRNANDRWKLSKETKDSKKLILNAMRNFSPIYIRQS